MTIEEFAKQIDMDSKTIEGWLDKDYIPGTTKEDGNWIIPENSRKPYTERRTKPNSDTPVIYKSILTGISKRRSVTASLYNMSQPEFDSLISIMIHDRHIESFEFSAGIVGYNITVAGTRMITSSNSKVKKLLIEAIKEFGIELLGTVGVTYLKQKLGIN